MLGQLERLPIFVYPMRPIPNTIQLPLPTPNEVAKFRRLHLEHVGTDLTEEEARRILTDLAQFFFLTLGHEWVRKRE